MASRIFTDPFKRINENYINIDVKVKSIQVSIQTKLKEVKSKTEGNILKLDALSPLKTLARGYSIAEFNGKILKNTENIKENDEVSIKLQHGKLKTIVKEIV